MSGKLKRECERCGGTQVEIKQVDTYNGKRRLFECEKCKYAVWIMIASDLKGW